MTPRLSQQSVGRILIRIRKRADTPQTLCFSCGVVCFYVLTYTNRTRGSAASTDHTQSNFEPWACSLHVGMPEPTPWVPLADHDKVPPCVLRCRNDLQGGREGVVEQWRRSDIRRVQDGNLRGFTCGAPRILHHTTASKVLYARGKQNSGRATLSRYPRASLTAGFDWPVV
ncbi:hypothetical protein H4582DRAFT_230506 [Lactarius indigo]|nr:hypothetical protein H4582DRAFT_230506 [Lactarius indigo]